MIEWSNKRYWIVGASEGLGLALAKKMSEAGASLVLTARNEARLKEIAASLPNKAEVLPLDITNLAAVKKSAKMLKNLDGFVFLAGAYWPMSAQEWDIGKVTKMVNVNLIGALHTLEVILPMFIEKNRGHLVFTGSLAGYRGLPAALGYGSSKAAIANLSETLRYDLKETSIKVQLINPGFIKTRLTDKNKFKMPQIMAPEDAAEKMFSNMNKNNFSSSFPAPFSWLFRVSRVLPDSIYFKLF
jgi:short-subunit dehydrogenase|tara:strand:+ start:264 stop:992 length:729 start_codon:yes stop_codon:yes gene_type:complete